MRRTVSRLEARDPLWQGVAEDVPHPAGPSADSHTFKSRDFEARGSNPRTVAYAHLKSHLKAQSSQGPDHLLIYVSLSSLLCVASSDAPRDLECLFGASILSSNGQSSNFQSGYVALVQSVVINPTRANSN